MYRVLTKRNADGKRRHYVYDENDNTVIDEAFIDFRVAQKAADLLNKELRKQQRRAYAKAQ